MDIRIIGSNCDTGSALSYHVKDSLEKNVKKYFANAISADVFFQKNKLNFSVNIVVNEGLKKGKVIIRANGNGVDAYDCFNKALQKVAKQLRRYKRKIKNYHSKEGVKDLLFAPKYILEDLKDESFDGDQEDTKPYFNVVDEKITNIEKLDISEAIMRMNLQDLPALVFLNKENNRINVIYNRKDGKISWIDPKNSDSC